MLTSLYAWLRGLFAQYSRPSGYRCYTTRFDREVRGEELPRMLAGATRQEHEAFRAALAEYELTIAEWRHAADIATIESAERLRTSVTNTGACLLIDHSGSLRGPLGLVATALAETVAGYWHHLGISYELLGFTTTTWYGGRSREHWIDAGGRPQPGRLCDLLHIVYRAADETILGAPWHVRYLLHPGLLRENVDGEAIQWASARLRSRPEARKLLVVLSDGAPVDDSTLLANGDGYLDAHLKQVLAELRADADIAIAAIAIGDHAAARYYDHHVQIHSPSDLADTLMPFLEGMLSGNPGPPP